MKDLKNLKKVQTKEFVWTIPKEELDPDHIAYGLELEREGWGTYEAHPDKFVIRSTLLVHPAVEDTWYDVDFSTSWVPSSSIEWKDKWIELCKYYGLEI